MAHHGMNGQHHGAHHGHHGGHLGLMVLVMKAPWLVPILLLFLLH